MADPQSPPDSPVQTLETTETPAGTDELERKARELAETQQRVQRGGMPLRMGDLLNRYRVLFKEAVQRFRSASDQELSLSYAAEWLLDNDYLVEQALRLIEENLPPGYDRQLPRLQAGPMKGLPRAYAIAQELTLESRAQLDVDWVKRFLGFYQAVTPLTMGELWALPIMLRLGVIQAMAQAVSRLTGVQVQQQVLLFPSFTWKDNPPTDEELVASGFISLRSLAAQDWKAFFEDLSLVEQVLSRDPAGYYPGMDFETRDRYRKVVEKLSLSTGKREERVAQAAVRLAENAQGSFPLEKRQAQSRGENHSSEPPRTAHVGYYLLARGRAELEEQIDFQPSGIERLRRWGTDHPALVYLGSISLLALLFYGVFTIYTLRFGGKPWQVALADILGLIPSLTVAVHLVNWAITHVVSPRVLPKMEYSEGLPEKNTTLVTIPALLSDPREVPALLQQLELHFLRNPDPHLYFALLSDFADANKPEEPEDKALIEEAQKGIQELNRKYGREGQKPFLLLHRERRFNPSEGSWIGWERKRGKLHELNQLILEARRTAPKSSPPDSRARVKEGSEDRQDRQTRPAGFAFQEGDLSVLEKIRYIITLDADTILPRDGALQLVGALAHPLNWAEFNPQGEVIAGYTLLQPRTEINPVSAVLSPFTRIFSGDTGLDLYTLAVSDVYQDLFGEGIYIGKGIYDVDAFEASLAGSVPENSLLSHDLFEGIHGRAGLASDIVLIENYPSHYLVQTGRMHRWIRGDWQLLPWLFPRVPAGDPTLGRKTVPNRLSLIDRWKIFDNLRRSLVQPVLLALLIAGWLGLLPGEPWFWTLAGILALAPPLFTDLAGLALQAGEEKSIEAALSGSVRPIRDTFLRWLLAVVFLPFEASLAANAIGVTLYRLFISRRQRLQWLTAAQAEQSYGESPSRKHTWTEMLFAPLAAIVLFVLLLETHPAALPAAIPLLLAWFLSPEVAYWISLPILTGPRPLEPEQERLLRSLARRTWFFFEQFISPEDQWLPPDHFQESPLGTVAHRTSPTNIGLNLLSSLGAYDLGYIGLLNLAARLHSTFDTLAKLERHRGHFLNWYDTRILDPLTPRYVSTVDSGNLAASLIALRQGLQNLDESPVLRWQTFQGLLDSLELLRDHTASLNIEKVEESRQALLDAIDQISQQIEAVKDRPEAWTETLFSMLEPRDPERAAWGQLNQRLLDLVEAEGDKIGAENMRRLRLYEQRARQRLDNAGRELSLLAPWLRNFANPPDLFKHSEPGQEPDPAWEALRQALHLNMSLGEIGDTIRTAQAQLASLQDGLEDRRDSRGQNGQIQEAQEWCEGLGVQLETAAHASKALLIGFQELDQAAESYILEMDFSFLYDPERQVFHIGYNLSTNRLDNNYYDLLASEARLASLVAIAKGEVPQSHWLHMARPIAQVEGRRVLLSWSATMFEYLMPLLLVKSYEGTLLHHSELVAAEMQIEYGQAKGVPWGISESGYYRFDPGMAYQYRAFGVPGLGYKRGLAEDLVIAPYASLLALPLRPRYVAKNISAFIQLGALGTYGLYEAIDFTPARMPLGRKYELVQEYMAHHQGMIFLSLVNYFMADIMVRRFHSDPRIRSVELLLQEQIPQTAPVEIPHLQEGRAIRPQQPQVIMTPWRARVRAPQPRVHFLSNGRYGLLITASGGGYSTWQETDLTRWRADTTLGGWGTWIYVKDAESGEIWSAGVEPTGVSPEQRDVYFNAHTAAFTRRDFEITTAMDIVVSPPDDVEVRVLTLTNHSQRPRRLRLTSYAEVILTEQVTDRRHPAFNKLFIESEYAAEENTLLFHRRPRSEDEEIFYLGHTLVAAPEVAPTRAYESDRARFLGRGRTARDPQAITGTGWLSGTVGATLDPVMALGQEVSLEPNESQQVAFLTLAAPTRQEALALAQKYGSWHTIQRTYEQARAQAEVELRQLGLHTPQLPRIQHLLSALLYPHPSLRAPTDTLKTNQEGQPALWAYSISGDFPILLAHLNSEEELPLVQDLLQAHAYWRNRNLKIDLVFLNEQGTTYGQELQGQIHKLLEVTGGDTWLNRRGGIFIIPADRMSAADRVLLETAARAVVYGDRGPLSRQLPPTERLPEHLPAFTPNLPDHEDPEPTPPIPRPEGLLFDNGLGGFSPDGHEYLVYLEPSHPTPAPWINVVANPEVGFLASESSLGYSWAANSGENRLTPWGNDPVSDTSGEALYLRDEETASVWSPTPLPAGAPTPILVRHGAGYTEFEQHSHGLKQQLRLFAAPEDPLKIVHLRLENIWNRTRRVTVTYYAEWVLGVTREEMQPYVIPEFEGETQALLARNPYNVEFGERAAFAAASKKLHGLTADRTEFLGRLGDRAQPAALKRIGLAGTISAGLDPCAALQLHVDLQPGEAEEVYFLLGQGANREAALDLVRKYQQPGQVTEAWKAATQSWDEILGAVQVHTPEPGMDLVLNRWLLYQALSCRIWGRSALYQSSGAFGFRDQLQDVMALDFAAPGLAREHLLRSAEHQFEAGDVLHWWHPPSGRGVRTRYSDDLLWLPFVTAHYVRTTGDTGVLDERKPFLQGPALDPGQAERYSQYSSTSQDFPLYEHCLRAIEKGDTSGPHGLPLIGGGDWNDGMNRVGDKGRGESIWLGWFIIATLKDFAWVCEGRGETARAERYRQRAQELAEALEAKAWDGQYYLRAFYDDGTPLGSARNNECQIDSIAQSWAVLSEAGNPERIRQAMDSLEQRLIRRQDRLILLFTPPFNKTARDPGYIKGYVPGTRENGGQYTHAALWTVWAYAQMGEGEKAEELFRLINPIYHTDKPEKVERYKVEPYVVVADIYSVAPHTGRGGWTWYTGSAGWMYRLGVEEILGLKRSGDELRVDPCIPKNWKGYEMTYRFGRATYHIQVENPQGVNRGVAELSLDGKALPDGNIPLKDDGEAHQVQVMLGQKGLA